jgi:hypothetical protein
MTKRLWAALWAIWGISLQGLLEILLCSLGIILFGLEKALLKLAAALS